MEIIVKKSGTEAERRKRETREAVLRHYYNREIRDGARFRSKAGTKQAILRVYEVR